MKHPFSIGDNVNVKQLPGDLFNHDFTGHVTGFKDVYIQVTDQDEDVWDCVPEQVTYNLTILKTVLY